MDRDTLLAVAKLARGRAKLRRERPDSADDGMARLGAERALEQFAKDLEVSAQHCSGHGRGGREDS